MKLLQALLIAVGFFLPLFLAGVSLMALAILALSRALQRKRAMFELSHQQKQHQGKNVPDPTTHAVTVATATPAIAVSATMFQITLWPFAWAFAFAFAALVYQDTLSFKRAMANVVVSTMIGGALAQLSAVPVLLWVGESETFAAWAQSAKLEMTAFIAIALGLTSHRVLPAILAYIDKKGAQS